MKTIMIFIVTWCIQVSDPCPDNRVGCLVHHYHYECNETTAFTNKDSASVFMREIESPFYFAPKPTLDSITLDEYLKKY